MSELIAPQPHTGVLTGPDAEQALSEMGLAAGPLSRACVEGVRTAVNQHSPLEPATALGFSVWAKIVGSLRTLLDEQGWRPRDTDNAPRSVSPDGTIAIAAIGGDECTACESSDPSNARARPNGSTFEAEVESNRAGSDTLGFTQPCFDLDLGLDDDSSPFNGQRTWMLLYFWDRGANELHLELSLPIDCEGGSVTQWETRIILPAQDLSTDDDLRTSNDGPPSAPAQDVDFEITAIP